MRYLFVLLASLFISCSNDGSDDNSETPPIVTPPIVTPSAFLSAADLSYLPLLDSKNIQFNKILSVYQAICEKIQKPLEDEEKIQIFLLELRFF